MTLRESFARKKALQRYCVQVKKFQKQGLCNKAASKVWLHKSVLRVTLRDYDVVGVKA